MISVDTKHTAISKKKWKEWYYRSQKRKIMEEIPTIEHGQAPTVNKKKKRSKRKTSGEMKMVIKGRTTERRKGEIVLNSKREEKNYHTVIRK